MFAGKQNDGHPQSSHPRFFQLLGAALEQLHDTIKGLVDFPLFLDFDFEIDKISVTCVPKIFAFNKFDHLNNCYF